MQDGQRFELTIANIDGRLSYKDLIKKTELTSEVTIAPQVPEIIMSEGKERAVYQLRGKEIIAYYHSIAEAAKQTGIRRQSINDVVKGKNKSTGGYEWKYA